MAQYLCSGIIPLMERDGIWCMLLLLHSKGLYWGFPKGHLDGNEDLKQAAIRELKEETGLNVSAFLYNEPFKEQYEFLRHGEKIKKEVFYFPALVEGKVNLQKNEIEDFEWVALDKAMAYITFQESKNVCRDFLEKISSGTIKL